MSNLGFGPLAQRPLADIPSNGTPGGFFSSFGQPVRRGLTAAIIASTGVIAAPFVPPATTPAFASFNQPLQKKLKAYDQPTQTQFSFQQSYIFSQFDQPRRNRQHYVDDSSAWLEQEPTPFQPYVFLSFDQPRKGKQHYIEDSSAWLEQEPPQIVTWGWNSEFSQPRKKSVLTTTSVSWSFVPFIPAPPDPYVPDTYRKRKHKKKKYDLVDQQIQERLDRIKDIELAVYGPPVEYKFTVPNYVVPPSVDPGSLPAIMLAIQHKKIAQIKADEDSEDEAEIEDILKEL